MRRQTENLGLVLMLAVFVCLSSSMGLVHTDVHHCCSAWYTGTAVSTRRVYSIVTDKHESY